jgi:hypothetical protein
MQFRNPALAETNFDCWCTAGIFSIVFCEGFHSAVQLSTWRIYLTDSITEEDEREYVTCTLSEVVNCRC